MLNVNHLISEIQTTAKGLQAPQFLNHPKADRARIDLEKTSVIDFLILDEQDFVHDVYTRLLRRPPSTEDLANLSNKSFQSVQEKISLLLEVFESTEFRISRQKFFIEGLLELHPIFTVLLGKVGRRKLIAFSSLILQGYCRSSEVSFLEKLSKEYCFSDAETVYFMMSFHSPTAPRHSKFYFFRKLTRKAIRLLFGWVGRFQLGLNARMTNLLLQIEVNNTKHRSAMKTLEAKVCPPIQTLDLKDQKAEVHSGEKSIEDHYAAFEDQFRGSAEVITHRLEFYMQLVEGVVKNNNAKAILDIGFGRCEWMNLARSRGIDVTGVDINPRLVQTAEQKGFNVFCADAIKFLRAAPPNTFAAITAYQVVEHIRFESVIELITEALRALAPGGVLILETPNCENLIVGSHDFWIDPTHIKPIPSATLEFFVKHSGFNPVKIEKRNPAMILDPTGINQSALENIVFRCNLDRDYSVIGYKPV